MIEVEYEIVENFIDEKIIGSTKYWFYDAIVEGKHLFEKPNKNIIPVLTRIYNIIKSKPLSGFLLNTNVLQKLYDNIILNYDSKINFIVGSPDPYDAFVRSHNNHSEIIIDVNRIIQYNKTDEETLGIFKNFITHELIHIANDKHIKAKDDFFNKMLWIIFDEGLAHYISYSDNILLINWNTNDMQEKRKATEAKMKEILKSNITKDVIINGVVSHNFWDKYLAIYGLFMFADIFNNNINNVKPIYEPVANWEKYIVQKLNEL